MYAVPTPPGWMTVPAVIGVPSPQSIVAVKSRRESGGGVGVGERGDRALNSGGENTGTGKIDASRCRTVGWVGEGASGASAMMAEPEKIVTEPPSSVTVTV